MKTAREAYEELPTDVRSAFERCSPSADYATTADLFGRMLTAEQLERLQAAGVRSSSLGAAMLWNYDMTTDALVANEVDKAEVLAEMVTIPSLSKQAELMGPLDRPDAALPPGFDYIDLAELLDVGEALLECVTRRVGTYDEQPGEDEVARRATVIFSRYRPAS